MSKPKVVAIADAPNMSTGFASVSRHALKVIHDMGFEVHLCAINWDGHCPNHEQYPYKYYNPAPKSGANNYDMLGHALGPVLIEQVKPDFVFILNSMGDLATRFRSDVFKRYKTMAFMAFEAQRFPKWWYHGAMSVDELVVFSEWQRNVLLSEGAVKPERISVINHGHDPEQFYPLWSTLEERASLRQSIGLPPDGFIAFRCDRNEYRKSWPQTMEAFGEFCYRTEAQNAYMYAHTSKDDYQGWDFDDLIDVYGGGIPEGRIILTNGYDSPWTAVSKSELNRLYNIADVYLSTTGGEAWGLTMHESQAAGTPVIGVNNSAVPEVVQSGWLADELTRSYLINSIEYNPPTPESTAFWLEQVYRDCQGEREDWWVARERGLAWAQNMSWDNVLKPLPNLIERLMSAPKKEPEEEPVA